MRYYEKVEGGERGESFHVATQSVPSAILPPQTRTKLVRCLQSQILSSSLKNQGVPPFLPFQLTTFYIDDPAIYVRNVACLHRFLIDGHYLFRGVNGPNLFVMRPKDSKCSVLEWIMNTNLKVLLPY